MQRDGSPSRPPAPATPTSATTVKTPAGDDEGGTLRPASPPTTARVSAYGGRPVDVDWLAEAQRRIERIRMADVRVEVIDAQGKPAPGAAVSIHMTRHAFLWGSALGDGVFLGATAAHRENRERYLEEFARLFNIATIEGRMRWSHWENPRSRQQLEEIMRWCEARGIALHGHTLVYPGWRHLPADLQEKRGDPAALRDRINRHITGQAGTLRGRVASWDVLNEPYSLQDLQRVVGYDQMAEWFRLARQADPRARLLVNENNVVSSGVKLEGYLEVLKRLVEDGAPFDAVGVQGHFRGSRFSAENNPLPTPAQVWDRLERLAAFDKAIRVTEFDIFNDQPEHSLILNDDDQARLTHEFLIATFSHPAVEGFTMWGFWDGSHWMNNAPLYRRDWSLKPSGRAWMELVRERWWTQIDVRADGQGVFAGRAYRGRHRVAAELDGRRAAADVEVSADGARVVLRLADAQP